MEARRPLTQEAAARFWARFSDDGGCDLEQEMAISEQASRGIQYLQEKGAAFERLAFEPDEDRGECKIAGTLDKFERVKKKRIGTQNAAFGACRH